MGLVEKQSVGARGLPSSRQNPAGEGEAGRWFAVQCQPHRETAAALHLQRQHFPVFFPRRAKTRRHARRIERVLVPFFPGYLFLWLDLGRDPWRSVNGTFGVARLVMAGDRPAPAPRGLVETLIEATSDSDVVLWRADLAVGQSVRLEDGPFAGLVGTLERLSDSDRVHVLLEIMGGKRTVLAARDSIVPAASSL